VEFIDTHCHLNHDSFKDDLAAVLDTASKIGVQQIIVPGWNVESSRRAVDLANRYSQLFAAVGIHPTDWANSSDEALKEIQQLAQDKKVVAIGEIGLDYYHETDRQVEQKELLQAMLAIAESTQKPVIIHSRGSMLDLLLLTKNWLNAMPGSNPLKTSPGVFHAFEGDLGQAFELVNRGFKLGAGGPLTYKNSALKQEVFSKVPESAILLETDAPFLTPVPYRGKRNEPAYVSKVGSVLAQLRNQPEEAILNRIYQNSYKMFLQEIIN
jgi:TatD DNase family protein